MSSKTVVSGIRWTLATTVIRRIIGILLFLFVAKWLSKEDFGTFRTYSLILIIVSCLGNPGLSVHYLTAKKREMLNLFSLLQIGFWLSIILFVLLSFSAQFLGRVYKSSELGSILQISAAFVIVEFIRIALRSIAQKHLMFKQLALSETWNVVVYSILALVLIFFFRDVRLYILLFYVGNTIEALYLLRIVPRIPAVYIFRIFSLRWMHLSLQNMRQHFAFLSNVSIVNLINLYSSNAPILFLGIMTEPGLIGLYFFASQVIGIPVGMLTASIGQVFFPVFASAARSDTLSGLKRFTALVLKLGIPLLLLYAIFLQAVLPLIFGTKWNAAMPLILYITIYYSSSLLHHPISGIPFICRKPHWELIWNSSTLVLRISVLYLGIYHSFNLAILLFCITSAVMNVVFYLMSVQLLGGSIIQSAGQLLRGIIPLLLLLTPAMFIHLRGYQLWGTPIIGIIYLGMLLYKDRAMRKELRDLIRSV